MLGESAAAAKRTAAYIAVAHAAAGKISFTRSPTRNPMIDSIRQVLKSSTGG